MEGHYEVWKYEFPATTPAMTSFDIPKGSRVLTCQVLQRDRICLWAIVDVKAEKESRDFLLVGTGHRILAAKGAKGLDYVGTVQLLAGGRVLHVFEMLAWEKF